MKSLTRLPGADGCGRLNPLPLNLLEAPISPNPDSPHGRDEAPGALDFLTGGGSTGALMRSHDWSSTAFGPPESWPQSLRSALSICLGSEFQIAIYWGPELAVVYNDAWSEIPGDKHPWALGRAAREVWPEIWSEIGPLFAHVLATGQATRSKDALLPMHRRGFTEECYFDYTFSPIRDEAGEVGGIFNIAVETTYRILEERRQRLLRVFRDSTAAARTAEEACALAVPALESDALDLPFCLIYLADGGVLRLAGSAGLPPGLPASPEALDPAGADSAWPAARAMAAKSAIFVEDLVERFGPLRCGPWPEPCRRAMVVRLPGLGTTECAGVLVAGLSPRLLPDLEYRSFVERIAISLSADLANARAYEEERRRADALAELDRAKTAFFSNVSHEFRTPLTLMLGPIEDLLGDGPGELSEAHRQTLRVVHRNGLRMQRLVNTLLDFSRIEAGRTTASYRPVDLASITSELVSSFRSVMERAGLAFSIDCTPLSGPVYVDREMWEKIVLNLLSNAFKYTLEGSISVTVRDIGDAVEVAVADTGSGIPEDSLPHIFERFHRVEGVRGRTYEGSGIGLALVRELVRLHGGTVGVASTPGKGSTFTVTLPFGIDHLPADRIGVERSGLPGAAHADAYVEEAMRWLPSPSLETGAPLVPPGPSRGRVLVADDNADMRGYVARLLGTQYGVTAVRNGKEALAGALENPPDLVLTDVMMPVMDGFALLKALRSRPETKSIPVILLSARSGEESRIEGMDAGADDYLVKPFTARELLARVGAHLALSRERRRAHDRLNRVFSHAPVGILVVRGPDLAVELANPVCESMFPGRRFPGRSLGEAIPELVAPIREAFEQVLETDRPFLATEFLVSYDRTGSGVAEDRWFNVSCQAIQDEEEAAGIIAVLEDVTAQVTARQQLERAHKELEEFAYVAGHDFQEPLRMINIYTQLLLRQPSLQGDAEAAQFAATIHAGVRRMEELIQDLLQYSRVVHADQEPAQRADLNKSLGEALSVLHIRLEETQGTVDAVTLPHVFGEEGQLALVFQNLIANSLKYRNPEAAPRVAIAAERNGPEWILTVRDNGIGFDQRHVRRIFGLFKRLHKDKYPGTGLGLAICKRIVERYGGRIWAESAGEGKGAAFFFALKGVPE